MFARMNLSRKEKSLHWISSWVLIYECEFTGWVGEWYGYSNWYFTKAKRIPANLSAMCFYVLIIKLLCADLWSCRWRNREGSPCFVSIAPCFIMDIHTQKSYLRLLCKAKLIVILGAGWPWLCGNEVRLSRGVLNSKHTLFMWLNLNRYLCFEI